MNLEKPPPTSLHIPSHPHALSPSVQRSAKSIISQNRQILFFSNLAGLACRLIHLDLIQSLVIVLLVNDSIMPTIPQNVHHVLPLHQGSKYGLRNARGEELVHILESKA
jgi:hypothetical protein